MGKPEQYRHLKTEQFASASSLITTAQPDQIVISTGLPRGDEAIYELDIRTRGAMDLTASSAGTILTDGHHRFLRSLEIETDKHGKIVSNIDGLALHRLNQFHAGAPGDELEIASAATGTPAFNANYVIPFAHSHLLRPFDGLLDMLLSNMTIRAQYGLAADFISGGTYSKQEIDTANFEVAASVIRNPNPQSVPSEGIFSELPTFQRSIEVLKIDISETTNGKKIALPFGDRIYLGVMVQQRNSSTLAELANTVITDTQTIGLEVNGFRWADALPFALLQAWNKSVFGLEAVPTGTAYIDFRREGKVGNFLDTLSKNQGTMNLVVDVTSVSNGQLWIVLDCLKPIPDAARRQAA